jgi:hypothetical protein
MEPKRIAIAVLVVVVVLLLALGAYKLARGESLVDYYDAVKIQGIKDSQNARPLNIVDEKWIQADKSDCPHPECPCENCSAVFGGNAPDDTSAEGGARRPSTEKLARATSGMTTRDAPKSVLNSIVA